MPCGWRAASNTALQRLTAGHCLEHSFECGGACMVPEREQFPCPEHSHASCSHSCGGGGGKGWGRAEEGGSKTWVSTFVLLLLKNSSKNPIEGGQRQPLCTSLRAS